MWCGQIVTCVPSPDLVGGAGGFACQRSPVSDEDALFKIGHSPEA
jgi:hypothetical protein